MEDNWLDIKTASEISGYHPAHLRRLAGNGAFGDQAKKYGNSWVLDRAALLEFVRRQKSKGGVAGPRR